MTDPLGILGWLMAFVLAFLLSCSGRACRELRADLIAAQKKNRRLRRRLRRGF